VSYVLNDNLTKLIFRVRLNPKFLKTLFLSHVRILYIFVMRYIFGEDAACYVVFICTNVFKFGQCYKAAEKNRLPVIVIPVYSELRVE
jgi:hypothetical protein